MNTFLECAECGFVLEAENQEDPIPRGRDNCPDCGGNEFEFTR